MNIVQALLVWKELLVELNVERAWRDYNECLGQTNQTKHAVALNKPYSSLEQTMQKP